MSSSAGWPRSPARSSARSIVTAHTEVVRRVEEYADIPGLTQMVVALLILLVLYRRPDGIVGRSRARHLLARRLPWLRAAQR